MNSLWDLFRKCLGVAGGGPAAQANSAGNADVLQLAPAATGRRVTRSSLTSCFRINSQAASAGNSRVAEAGPAGLNPVAQDSRRISTRSSKDKGLAISLPIKAAPKIPAQGKQSATSSSCIAQSDGVIHKLPSKRSHTGCAAESNDVKKNKDHLKKCMPSSSKQEPCITEGKGSSSAEQADPSGSTNTVKPDSETTGCHYTRSSLAFSSPTTAHAAPGGSSRVAKAGPADPNPVAQDSLRISTRSSKDKGLAIPLPTTVAPKVLAQDSQKISTRTSKDKGLAVSPPTRVAPKVPAQGKQSAASTTGNAQSDAGVIKLPTKKGHTGCATESNDVLKNMDNRKKDDLENNDRKSMPSSSEQEPSDHIKCEDLFSIDPLEPLGERCQLCGIDLTFTLKGSASRYGDPPSSAVLPCSHSYHDSCLEDVFGPVEPPCILCLEVEAPNGCGNISPRY